MTMAMQRSSGRRARIAIQPKILTYRQYPRRPGISEYVKSSAYRRYFSALEYMYKFAAFLPSPLVQVCPKMTILRTFMERVMALRSLHSQLVAQACAHRKRALHARAQNAVISRSSTYFNCQDFLRAKVQILQSPKFCACKGSKCSYFVRVCACTNWKCFKFPVSCDFQGFEHAKLQKGISWDFLHAKARRASLSRAVHTKALQVLLEVLQFPRILCTQGFHMLQFPGNLAHKDSKCRASIAGSI